MVKCCRLWLLLLFCARSGEGDSPPNPTKDFEACRRPKASLVCNPDGVIPFEDAEKLDRLAHDVRRITDCLCRHCVAGSGVSVGVFIAGDLPSSADMNKSWEGNELAKWIRERWKLGECEDDITVVLITRQNLTGFSIGTQLQHLLPQEVANKIFNDCMIHFRFGYFTQGFESIINSFGDVLVRMQRQKSNLETSNFGLALGVALGVCVFLILMLAAVILLWRQAKRKHKSSREMKSFNNAHSRKDKEYHPCKLNEKIEDSYEEDSESDVLYESANYKEIVPFRTKRHLSDVPEESEEILKVNKEGSLDAQSQNRSQEVTEL